MEEAKAALTELQFTILDGMADLYEDVEQLYVYANRQFHEEQQLGVHLPNMMLHVQFPLRDVMDEIKICSEMVTSRSSTRMMKT